MRTRFLVLLLLTVSQVIAQQKTLSIEEFFLLIKTYHPVAKQAGLEVEMAQADVVTAKGAFDPQVESDHMRKELDGLLYYDHTIHQLRIPTWFGVDIQAGMESLSGERTSTPDTKGPSTYIGISMPVVKNLLLDKRRATLQQARIFQNASLQEQRATINNLLMEAANSYWNWWQYHQLMQVFVQAIQNAEKRFQMVRTAYQIGERPAIDTLEAFTQWQSFQLQQRELQIEQFNAQQELSVFLWDQAVQPYALSADVLPQVRLQPSTALQLDNLLQQIALHPELQQYNFKLNALNIDRRLKFQSLLPSVYIKYNQLSKSHDLSKNFTTPLLQNNYRYGVSVALPLRLSEGRGEYRKAKLKIQHTQLEQWNKRLSIENKVKQYYNQWQQLQQQVALQQEAVRLFGTLQRAEEQRFLNGEGSLFLINSRELKTLEAQQKLITLQAKYNKAYYYTIGALGQLN